MMRKIVAAAAAALLSTVVPQPAQAATATRVELRIPSTLAYRHSTVLAARVIPARGGPIRGVPVVFQVAAATGGRWVSLKPVATGMDGYARINFTGSSSTRVRATFGRTANYGGNVSSARVLVVTPLISATRSGEQWIMPSTPTTFSGSVVPVRAGAVVLLQKLAGKRWITAGSTRQTNRGTFSVSVVPTAAGPTQYRAATAPLPTLGSGYSSAVNSSVLYTENLVDLEPVTGGADGHGSVDINGTHYDRSFWFDTVSCGRDTTNREETVEYDLGRDAMRFQAIAGVDDRSPSGTKATIEVVTDGVQRLVTPAIELGQSQSIDVDVTAVLRLTLHINYEVGLGCEVGYAALARPAIFTTAAPAAE